MIRQIENDKAVQFLRDHKANREHISITSADMWMGYYEDELLGVIGIVKGKTDRIKAYFVTQGSRKRGIGKQLLDAMMAESKANRCTAFCTEDSVRLFERKGFRRLNQNKNGIWFVERNK